MAGVQRGGRGKLNASAKRDRWALRARIQLSPSLPFVRRPRRLLVPGPLDPESSGITTRPPRLPLFILHNRPINEADFNATLLISHRAAPGRRCCTVKDFNLMPGILLTFIIIVQCTTL